LSYGNPRADVGAVYGAQFTPSGFGMTVNNLAPGQYALAVYAHSTVAGTFNNSRVVHVTITPPASRPALSIDTPRAGAATQPLWFGGWAVDLGAPAGTGVDAVHVWAYPIGGGPAVFAGAAAPNLPRPDVGTVFGSQFTNSGYGFHASILAPGAYTLVAYARSTVAGAFNAWQSVQVTITNAPLVTIDTPAAGAVTQPASLAGWALDVGATSGTGADAVHVWAYPTGGGPAVFAGAATPNLPRPDVGAAFGSRFTNSGYRLVLNTLPVGSYTLVAYVRSTVTGAFTASPGVAITTGNAVVGGGGS
jgi:hypothetical protein